MSNVEASPTITKLALNGIAANITAWWKNQEAQVALEDIKDTEWKDIKLYERNQETLDGLNSEIESCISFAEEFGVTKFDIVKIILGSFSNEQRAKYFSIVLKNSGLTNEQKAVLLSDPELNK